LYGAWLKLHYILLGYVVLWQHVLRVICVLCAVQNGTELGCFFVYIFCIFLKNIQTKLFNLLKTRLFKLKRFTAIKGCFN
jgi:hypothetical protein